MGKVISVANQKGGVGKTTTCVNLGTALARAGHTVCLIDLDPQGSLTQSLGYRNPDEMECTMADVLKAEIEPCDKMSPTDFGGIGRDDVFEDKSKRQFEEISIEEEYDNLSQTLRRSILHHEEGISNMFSSACAETPQRYGTSSSIC